MRRMFSTSRWAAIGLLVAGAGMPYCAAALGWAATQDETSITMRADVAVGVVIAAVGWTILAVVLVFWGRQALRRRRAATG